jgi:hypothetical protein
VKFAYNFNNYTLRQMELNNEMSIQQNSAYEVGEYDKSVKRRKYFIGMNDLQKSATDPHVLTRGFSDEFDLDDTADSIED